MSRPAPWKHQENATAFLIAKAYAYLQLPMGAGKSRSVIDAVEHLGLESMLIVCPKSVTAVWPVQFAAWQSRDWTVIDWTALGSTTPVKLKRAGAAIRAARAAGRPFALVLNYDAVRGVKVLKALMSRTWDFLLMDEAHRIKAPKGANSKACAKLSTRCRRRVGMSGTPLPHDALDIWAQYRAIEPRVFGGSFFRFKIRYAVMGGYQQHEIVAWQNQPEMRARMHTVMHSPKPGEVVLNLPPVQHEQIVVNLCPAARRVYDALDEDLVAQVKAGVIDASNALVKLLRLQQLASGLAVAEVDDETTTPEEVARSIAGGTVSGSRVTEVVCNAKRDALMEIIEDTDEPVVVFGKFRRDIDIVHEAAKLARASSLELSGQRNELAQWQGGAGRVLAVQIGAGSEGITLVRARICVYLSTGFDMGAYEQSLARTHRPGQKRNVVYYHIHARDTVDQKVYGALRSRKNLVAAALAGVGVRTDSEQPQPTNR